MAVTATYVGSEGHFLPSDGGNARGYWSDQLDPKYLYLGARLADTGKTATTVAADCATYSLPCPSTTMFINSQALSQALTPFPYQKVADAFGYVTNTNYNALQVMLSLRSWHGLVVNANYTFSRSIDDGGTFRTGYAIPAGTVVNQPNTAYAPDRIERSVSTSNQPQHFVLTAVWAMPLGKTILSSTSLERNILGGFKFSGIYQAYNGSPLAVTASACQTNVAQITCMPTLNPNFTGPVRQNGKWGQGVSSNSSDSNYFGNVSFITPSTGTLASYSGPFIPPTLVNTTAIPSFTFGNSPRTAPYNLYGPGNYQLDLAMVRSFPLHLTAASKLNFRAEWYNVTNHTLWNVASAAVGNASFGQVTPNANNRKAAQFSARIEF